MKVKNMKFKKFISVISIFVMVFSNLFICGDYVAAVFRISVSQKETIGLNSFEKFVLERSLRSECKLAMLNYLNKLHVDIEEGLFQWTYDLDSPQIFIQGFLGCDESELRCVFLYDTPQELFTEWKKVVKNVICFLKNLPDRAVSPGSATIHEILSR